MPTRSILDRKISTPNPQLEISRVTIGLPRILQYYGTPRMTKVNSRPAYSCTTRASQPPQSTRSKRCISLSLEERKKDNRKEKRRVTAVGNVSPQQGRNIRYTPISPCLQETQGCPPDVPWRPPVLTMLMVALPMKVHIIFVLDQNGFPKKKE